MATRTPVLDLRVGDRVRWAGCVLTVLRLEYSVYPGWRWIELTSADVDRITWLKPLDSNVMVTRRAK